MADLKYIEIPMDDELMAALERHAKEVGMSEAEVVRACLIAEFGQPETA